MRTSADRIVLDSESKRANERLSLVAPSVPESGFPAQLQCAFSQRGMHSVGFLQTRSILTKRTTQALSHLSHLSPRTFEFEVLFAGLFPTTRRQLLDGVRDMLDDPRSETVGLKCASFKNSSLATLAPNYSSGTRPRNTWTGSAEVMLRCSSSNLTRKQVSVSLRCLQRYSAFKKILTAWLAQSAPRQIDLQSKLLLTDVKRCENRLITYVLHDLSVVVKVIPLRYLLLLSSMGTLRRELQDIVGDVLTRSSSGKVVLLMKDIDSVTSVKVEKLEAVCNFLKEMDTINSQLDSASGTNLLILGFAERSATIHPRIMQLFQRQASTTVEFSGLGGTSKSVEQRTALLESVKAQIRSQLTINDDRRCECIDESLVIEKQVFCWEDVGGLGHVKVALEEMIAWPLKYPKLFNSSMSRKGALLSGPPGTGKTLIAKAASTTFNLYFLSIKGPELLNMYVGESERCIRELFERAKALSPTLIFFDEIDAFAKTGTESSLTNRILSQIITELDSVKGENIFVLAASNRIELVDASILRPGRLGLVLHVHPCETEDTKIDIFKALTRKFSFSHDFEIKSVVPRLAASAATGADIYACCVSAWINAARRSISLHSNVIEIVNADFY